MISDDDIHLRQKVMPERDIFFVLILIIVLILESFALLLVVQKNPIPALLLHFIAFLIIAGAAKIKDLNNKDSRFAWVTMIALPLMGPFAPAGTLFALFWYYISKEKSLTFRQWHDSIFPPHDPTLAEVVYDRISFGRDQAGLDYSVTYLMDVIKLGSDDKKREAILKILRNYDPGFAPILKMALEDDHNSIRVQAATAMTKLKKTYYTTSVKLERLRREWPDKNSISLELAKHYDDYAFSGLLDDKQAAEYQQLSYEYYEEFIDYEPQDSPLIPKAKLRMARLLLRMDKLDEACTHFQHLINENPEPSDAYLWYGECLYRMGRYDILREIAGTLAQAPMAQEDALRYPDYIRGIIELWSPILPSQLPKQEAI